MDEEKTTQIQKVDDDWPDMTPAPGPPSIPRADRESLWQEVLHARRQRAYRTWEDYKKSPCQLFGSRPEGWTEDDERHLTQTQMERISTTASKDLRWDDFSELSHLTDEEAQGEQWTGEVVALWKKVKDFAREELLAGHRAAQAMEHWGATPLDRARFLALRESLAQQWQPKGGVELALIDQMAQAHTMWERWLKIATLRQSTQWTGDQKLVFERSVWAGPPQTEAEATKAAGDEADRWHRVYVRAMRQLRDLRRYNIQITAGQVNIAQQQVNVAEPKERTAEEP